MWPDNRLTERLGLTHPIIQAPMAGASSPAMAAAAANAGALGSIGAALMSAEDLHAAWAEARGDQWRASAQLLLPPAAEARRGARRGRAGATRAVL